MDATALCFRLLMKMLILLVAQVVHSSFAQKPDAVLPSVSPDRLQFFEYDTVSVSCEEFTGPTEWRVMRKLNQKMQPDSDNWNSSAPSYTITATFARDTGEYWCEDAEGHKSGAVNITVTAGSAILDVPARPVVEGQDVVLHCRKKDSQSKHIAEFYKNGSHLERNYDGSITIRSVSKSDEGLYKCKIPGAGESPESWLSVINQNTTAHEDTAHEDTRPSQSHSSSPLPLLWIIVGVLSAGLLLCRRKDKARTKASSPEESVIYSTVYYRPVAPD